MIREAPDEVFGVSAPGGVCLFGEELAPFGLRTIRMAVSLRVYVRAEARRDNLYRIQMGGQGEAQEFVPLGGSGPGDPLRRAVQILAREGLAFDRGCNFDIHSDMPPETGLGYSAAMMVAWVTALLRIHGRLKDYSALRIAALAGEAASVDAPEPLGIADHIVSAVGGINQVDHGDGCKMTPITGALDGLVIADVGLDTIRSSNMAQAAASIVDADRQLKSLQPGFDFRTAGTDEVLALLQKLPDAIAAAAYAVVVDRDTAEHAYRLLVEDVFDQDAFGELLDTHHEMLRDHLRIVAPQVERLIEVCKQAGALGCKLNTPRGRTATIYAPGRTEPVVAAIREAAARAYPVTKSQGVNLED